MLHILLPSTSVRSLYGDRATCGCVASSRSMGRWSYRVEIGEVCIGSLEDGVCSRCLVGLRRHRDRIDRLLTLLSVEVTPRGE